MARDILIIVYDRVNIFSLMSMVEAFTSVNISHADDFDDKYNVHLLSLEGGMIEAWNGYQIQTLPIASFKDASFDTLIISGGWGFSQASSQRSLIDWIDKLSKRCRRLCIIGAGLFLAAKAGLLKDQRVAIHPVVYDQFTKICGSAVADQNAVFTRNGDVWTSAGMTAAIDVTLAMIEEVSVEAWRMK